MAMWVEFLSVPSKLSTPKSAADSSTSSCAGVRGGGGGWGVGLEQTSASRGSLATGFSRPGFGQILKSSS